MDITLHGFARFSLPLVVLKDCGVVVVLLSCRCHVVVLSLRGDEGCHLRATVLAEVVLKICSIACQKLYGSRDLSYAPFGENYLYARSAFPRRSYIPNLKSLV